MNDMSARFRQGEQLPPPPPLPVPNQADMSRRGSAEEEYNGSMASYPSFSKQHSREAVRSAEEPRRPKPATVTSESAASEGERRVRTPVANSRPSSPPSTSDESERRREKEYIRSNRSSLVDGKQDMIPKYGIEEARTRSSHLRAEEMASPRRKSNENISEVSYNSNETIRSKTRGGAVGGSRDVDQIRDEEPHKPFYKSPSVSTDSQATSIANTRVRASMNPPRPSIQTSISGIMQDSLSSSQKYTSRPNTHTNGHNTPLNTLPRGSSSESIPNSQSYRNPSITIPPPASPYSPFSLVDLNQDPPRVDYLLYNGGLPYTISRSVIPSLASNQPRAAQNQSRIPQPPSAVNDAMNLFAPVSRRLQDFERVLDRNGSVAVATGYRSVARRLLDRLEHVFARDISSERCDCVLCNTRYHQDRPEDAEEDRQGLSWGEMLEFVSGRRDLPPWPPFSFVLESNGTSTPSRVDLPMQKLDPDVPEEFRQHYMRQNDKTKRSVQSWLQSQDIASSESEPPGDVDDETLSFAMLTRIEADKRAYFVALMRGMSSLINAKGPTASAANSPPTNVDTSILDKTAAALQRLYRLRSPPRKPECAIYLVNNPNLHGMLATLVAITPAEWEILTSGRFDGFLWSGNDPPHNNLSSAYSPSIPSRGPTPAPGASFPRSLSNTLPSRNTTPYSPINSMSTSSPSSTNYATGSNNGNGSNNGGPVQFDEETEILVLSELEQSIHKDMEVIEDVFESLHRQAEALRLKLRARAAGLSLAGNTRRGYNDDSNHNNGANDGMMGINGQDNGGGKEKEGWEDERSELAPEDSASNISYVRLKRGEERKKSNSGSTTQMSARDMKSRAGIIVSEEGKRRR